MRTIGWFVVVAACGSPGSDRSPPPSPPRDAGAALVPPLSPPPPFEISAPQDKLVGVGRGARHACVVRASGAVDCWGEPRAAALAANPSVRRVAGITDAIAISSTGNCVVRRTGEAACLAADELAMRPVPGITGAVGLDTRGECFLGATGEVTCLDGDKAWRVPNVHDAISLTSGEYLVCAVRKTGQVACGSATTEEAFHPVRGLAKVTSLAIAGEFSAFGCAISERHLRCFGLEVATSPGAPMAIDTSDDAVRVFDPVAFDGASQLALWTDPMTRQFQLEAVIDGKVITSDLHDHQVVPLLVDAVTHAPECAIRAQGSLVCWGANSAGVLAQPTTEQREDVPATTVAGLGDVIDLALGWRESYALTRDGRVWRWGVERFEGRSVPFVMPLGLGPEHVAQITADRLDHVCMRSAGGDVWCQVGTGTSRLEQLDTAGIRDIQSSDGVLYAFRTDGAYETHRIGDRHDLEPPMSVVRSAATDIVEIADREDFCARHKSGAVDCDLLHAEIKTATALAAGVSHACAVQRGRVWCWLSPWDAAGIRHPIPPFEMPGLREVTDLASSKEDVCAVHDHGRVSCWRFGDDDQKPTDLQVVIPSGAVDVELGKGWRGLMHQISTDGPSPASQFGCAIMADHTVKCWGMNMFGEIADGSLFEASSPIGVKL